MPDASDLTNCKLGQSEISLSHTGAQRNMRHTLTSQLGSPRPGDTLVVALSHPTLVRVELGYDSRMKSEIADGITKVFKGSSRNLCRESHDD
jgi:hypothetical protein